MTKNADYQKTSRKRRAAAYQIVKRQATEAGYMSGPNDTGGLDKYLLSVNKFPGTKDSDLCCLDCGLLYYDFGVDATLPHDQWNSITPEGREIILCASCMVKRAAKMIRGLIAIRMRFDVALTDSVKDLF